jgi:hypothetical protein
VIDELASACRAGENAAAERLLERIEDEEARLLVERIGGRGAMVRFLTQRRHVLEPAGTLTTWLRSELHAAEPLHLFDLHALPERAAAEPAMARRLAAHLQFHQPPDPVRWSRPIPTPAETAFLGACARGDAEAIGSADPAAVHARDRRGRDALTLLASSGAHELVPAVCALGVHKSPGALAAAVSPEMVAALQAAGVPSVEPGALDDAAAAGDVARLRMQLDEVYRARPTLLDEEGPERPLHVAVYFDQPAATLFLLERGYSAAGRNTPIGGRHVGPEETWNETPLGIAIARGATRAFTVLMNSVDWFQGRRARRK